MDRWKLARLVVCIVAMLGLLFAGMFATPPRLPRIKYVHDNFGRVWYADGGVIKRERAANPIRELRYQFLGDDTPPEDWYILTPMEQVESLQPKPK